jgi:hypothetical protein
MQDFKNKKEFSQATGMPWAYFDNEESILTVQNNKSCNEYKAASMYCIVKGFYISVTHEEGMDWEYYSKAWHRRHGPKKTITGRFVNFYKRGKKQRRIAITSFAGNYLINAIIEQFSIKKEVAGITIKKKTGTNFKRIQMNDRFKVKYEGKLGKVKIFSRWILDAKVDYCSVDNEGNTCHTPNKLEAVKTCIFTEQSEKKIIVREESLREVLRVELETARDFEWSGWRIPVYVSEDGICSAGGWLSNNSWQPGIEELPKVVEPWTMADREYEEFTADDVECEIEDIIDRYIDQVLTEDEKYTVF